MSIHKIVKGLTVITILFICSCSSEEEERIKNRKEIGEVLDKEHFDTSIINALPYYDRLKDIILTNKDSIFKYRDAKTMSDSYHEKGEDSALFISESYSFIYITGKGGSSSAIGPNTIPEFILDSIRHICEYLGPSRLAGFSLDKHASSLEIDLKDLYDEKADVETQHTLQWDWDYTNQKIDFMKDSMLGSKWIYYIRSEKRPGR